MCDDANAVFCVVQRLTRLYERRHKKWLTTATFFLVKSAKVKLSLFYVLYKR